MRLIRRICYFSLALLVLLCALYPKACLLKIVDWQLKKMAVKYFEAPLSYSELKFENGGLLVLDARIKNSEQSLSIDKFFVKPALSLHPLNLKLQLEVDQCAYSQEKAFFPDVIKQKGLLFGKYIPLSIDVACQTLSINIPSFCSITASGDLVWEKDQEKAHIKGGSATLEGTLFGLDCRAKYCQQDKLPLLKVLIEDKLSSLQTLWPEKERNFIDAFENDQIRCELNWDIGHSKLLQSTILWGTSDNKLLTLKLENSKDGYIKLSSDHLPLEKIAPFILGGTKMKLTGFADVEAVYKNGQVVIHYATEELCLNHPQFALTIPQTKPEGKIFAIHTIDFIHKTHEGFLPLSQATYWQKKQDFHLTKIDALAHFSNRSIVVHQIRANGDGLNFQGDVELEIQNAHSVDLKIKAERIEGPAPAAQKFLSHFKESFLWDLPLEGHICSKGASLFFHYHFAPQPHLITAIVRSHVELFGKTSFGEVKNFSAWIDFNCKNNVLDLHHGRALIYIAAQDRHVEVLLPQVHCVEFPDFMADGVCLIENTHPIKLSSYRNGLGTVFAINGAIQEDPIAIRLIHSDSLWTLDYFSYGKWSAKASKEGNQESIKIEHLTYALEDHELTFKGIYDTQKKRLQGCVGTIALDLTTAAAPLGQYLGRVEIDADELCTHLPIEWKHRLKKLEIKGKLTLEGEFHLSKIRSAPFFKGQAYSRDLKIKGLEVDRLSMQLTADANKISVSNMVAQDPAGSFYMTHAYALKDSKEKWQFYVDKAIILNLQLFRFMKKPIVKEVHNKSFYRRLMVPFALLENFCGNVGAMDTYIGSGRFEFSHETRKNFVSQLLYLPSEITRRIGLDLTALVPVMGKVEYQIKEGRIVMTALKGTYSDGKRSKFYLPEGSSATLDFNGNLDMKVKMKHYSLLMKLAELFTISVKGNILHPNFTLVRDAP